MKQLEWVDRSYTEDELKYYEGMPQDYKLYYAEFIFDQYYELECWGGKHYANCYGDYSGIKLGVFSTLEGAKEACQLHSEVEAINLRDVVLFGMMEEVNEWVVK